MDESLSDKICDDEFYIETKDVKEAVKKRNLELKKIELNLMNNEAEDWDIALSRVRNLINDKDKIFGRKLI